jgi:hypothetical protein
VIVPKPTPPPEPDAPGALATGRRRRLPLQPVPEEIRRELLAAPRPPLWLPLLVASLLGLAAAVVLAVSAWHSLPARLATHYDDDGQATSWGSKWVLILFPLAGIVLFVMMTLISRFPMLLYYPIRLTRQNAHRQVMLALLLIAWMRMAMIWLLVYLEAGAVAAAGGHPLRNLGPMPVPVMALWIAWPFAGYFVLARRWR